MHRTQILLENRQYDALRAWARREDKSLSEVVRMAVERFLGEPAPRRARAALSRIRALARDPRGPSAAEHDRLLYGEPK